MKISFSTESLEVDNKSKGDNIYLGALSCCDEKLVQLLPASPYFGVHFLSLAIPIGNCNLIRGATPIFAFTLPLSILPLTVRVSCLYRRNKYMDTVFFALWLAVLATCIGMAISFKGSRIGETKFCELKMGPGFIMNTHAIVPLINDVIIFAATSWGLMGISYSDSSLWDRAKILVYGKDLQIISKSILRDGQAYFL